MRQKSGAALRVRDVGDGAGEANDDVRFGLEEHVVAAPPNLAVTGTQKSQEGITEQAWAGNTSRTSRSPSRRRRRWAQEGKPASGAKKSRPPQPHIAVAQSKAEGTAGGLHS